MKITPLLQHDEWKMYDYTKYTQALDGYIRPPDFYGIYDEEETNLYNWKALFLSKEDADYFVRNKDGS